MGVKKFFERILISTYRENDTPATRETYLNEKGDIVQIVRYDDGSTPTVLAKKAGMERGIIRRTDVFEKEEEK